jgi:CheY-like chemotaxis protein
MGSVFHRAASCIRWIGQGSNLIVDDNIDTAETFSALLTPANHIVRTAADVEIALDMLTALCPEIVLLEIALHGMDGFKLAKAIRARTDTRGVVLIAVTC